MSRGGPRAGSGRPLVIGTAKQLNLQVEAAHLERWKGRAEEAEISLAAWVRQELNRAAADPSPEGL